MPSFKLVLLAFAVAAVPSSTVVAQDISASFRLAQAPGNVQGCIAYDSALTRVHTFTLKGGQAELKSAGGIDDKLKLVSPNVYATVLSLGGAHLDVVANVGATPKTLTVTEKNRGCKWMAVAK